MLQTLTQGLLGGHPSGACGGENAEEETCAGRGRRSGSGALGSWGPARLRAQSTRQASLRLILADEAPGERAG